MIRRPTVALAALALLALCGCFNPFDPRIGRVAGVSDPPPYPSTPANLLRLHEWCWNHRAIDEYREIFTADYVFQFGLSDSAGNAYRDRPFNREAELDAANNLFVSGTATAPPATRIRLSFDPTLLALPDSRPGKNAKWHKMIATQVNLRIQAEDNEYEVTGVARFFVVRGDSALIPDELSQRGFTNADTTRWFIERWEDETIGSNLTSQGPPPSRALRSPSDVETLPLARSLTWGQVKRDYVP